MTDENRFMSAGRQSMQEYQPADDYIEVDMDDAEIQWRAEMAEREVVEDPEPLTDLDYWEEAAAKIALTLGHMQSGEAHEAQHDLDELLTFVCDRITQMRADADYDAWMIQVEQGRVRDQELRAARERRDAILRDGGIPDDRLPF